MQTRTVKAWKARDSAGRFDFCAEEGIFLLRRFSYYYLINVC